MPWTVIREDFNGSEMSEKVVFTPSNRTVFDDQKFLLLKYIDPYDDSTFNRLMCIDLVKDLKVLKEIQPQDQQQLNSLIELAEACTKDPHTYLKFYGD